MKFSIIHKILRIIIIFISLKFTSQISAPLQKKNKKFNFSDMEMGDRTLGSLHHRSDHALVSFVQRLQDCESDHARRESP